MPVPEFQTFMLPLLRRLGDGREHQLRDLVRELGDEFNIPEAERLQPLPSGRGSVLYSRVRWARTYMKQAGLLDDPARGIARISEEGQRVLASRPSRIDINFLRRYPAFVDFRRRSSPKVGGRDGVDLLTPVEEAETPEETLERVWTGLNNQVGAELLERIMAASPAFFEQLVVRLLVAMGYGGSYAEAAQVVGGSGDQGIDGVIKEDRLGLDAIYVQAKRWQGPVRRPDIQAFAGSLDGARARKGVFITTSHFTPDAHEYVARIEKRIVLIDGPALTQLMIEHGVG